MELFDEEVTAAIKLESEIINLEKNELKLEENIELSEGSSNIKQVISSVKESENTTEIIVKKYFEEVDKLEKEAVQLKKILKENNVNRRKLDQLENNINKLEEINTKKSRIEELMTEINKEKRNTIKTVGAALAGTWTLKELGNRSNRSKEPKEPDTKFSKKEKDLKVKTEKGELTPPGEGEVQIEYWSRLDGEPKALQVTARNLSHTRKNYKVEILLKPPNGWSTSGSFQISSGSQAMYSSEEELKPGDSFTPRLSLHSPDQLPEESIFEIVTYYYPKGKPNNVKKSKLKLEIEKE